MAKTGQELQDIARSILMEDLYSSFEFMTVVEDELCTELSEDEQVEVLEIIENFRGYLRELLGNL